MTATREAPRVVVADDSAFMRRLISDVLTRDGMRVVAEAANGREAIEACKPVRTRRPLARPRDA